MANYRRIARAKARKYGINPRYFVRQIGAESGFNPNARSPAGADGIAQIMPETARGWGVNTRDPVASLDAAAKNMAGYLKSYGGDWEKALAAYNAGPGAVEKYGGVPPFAETKAYIAKILRGGDSTQPHQQTGGEGMAGVAKSRIRTTSTTTTDTDGALVDALMAGAAGRRKGGLLADASRRIDSGAYTTTQRTRTKETVPVGAGGSVRQNAVKGLQVQKDANHGAMALINQVTGDLPGSGERTPANNAAVGGATGSDHLTTNRWASAKDVAYGSGAKIAKRLGIKNWKPGTYDRHIIVVGGRKYSVQILEDVEGHTDHSHVGIQRVR